MIKAVIFDVDGTLVNSVDSHAHAWQDAFNAFGHDFAFDKIRSQIGKGGDQLMPVFLSHARSKRKGLISSVSGLASSRNATFPKSMVSRRCASYSKS
jgi:beta-phosphoglucomutase-like phosphatase (HAD superfamily)